MERKSSTKLTGQNECMYQVYLMWVSKFNNNEGMNGCNLTDHHSENRAGVGGRGGGAAVLPEVEQPPLDDPLGFRRTARGGVPHRRHPLDRTGQPRRQGAQDRPLGVLAVLQGKLT